MTPIAYAYGVYVRDKDRIKGVCFKKPLILPQGFEYDLSEGLGISKNIDGHIQFSIKVKGWAKDPADDDDVKALRDLQALVNSYSE